MRRDKFFITDYSVKRQVLLPEKELRSIVLQHFVAKHIILYVLGLYVAIEFGLYLAR